MKKKFTSKKSVLANEYMAVMNTNERKIKFIVEKDVISIGLKFYLRALKIDTDFRRLIKENENILIKKGWSIGQSILSYSSRDIFIYVVKSEGSSGIEMKCKFNVGKDILRDIQSRINIIKETLTIFYNNIEELKVSMDVDYYFPKYIMISSRKLIDILKALSYERMNNARNKYRKFQVNNNHNITSQVTLGHQEKQVNMELNLNVENIVIDQNNVENELEISLYYVMLEYSRLHFNILNELDTNLIASQREFYNQLMAEN